MTKLYGTNPLNEVDLQWKTTTNIKSGISLQPLYGLRLIEIRENLREILKLCFEYL